MTLSEWIFYSYNQHSQWLVNTYFTVYPSVVTYLPVYPNLHTHELPSSFSFLIDRIFIILYVTKDSIPLNLLPIQFHGPFNITGHGPPTSCSSIPPSYSVPCTEFSGYSFN